MLVTDNTAPPNDPALDSAENPLQQRPAGETAEGERAEHEAVAPTATPDALQDHASDLIAPPTQEDAFPAAPAVDGEFTLPLDQLVIGADHTRRDYDFETGIGKVLFHVALDPALLAPITVMPVENVWCVIDGWARVCALRLQHGDSDPTIRVRVLQWRGTAKAAVYERFSQLFLTLASKPIEAARQLAQMNALWSVPQQALAARVGWTESKVSKHLRAAEGEQAEPRFARLLLAPQNPSLDYMYKVGKAWNDAVQDDAKHSKRSAAKGSVAALRKRLEALLARRERFEPKAALVALGLAQPKPEPELPFGAIGDIPSVAPVEPFVLEDVVGHDDLVIGALEMHGDGGRRLLLPAEADVAEMSAVEKVAARNAYHDAIDRLFG